MVLAAITAKQNRTLLKVFPLVVLLGLALLFWGLRLSYFHGELVVRGESAEGLVVGLVPSSGTSASGRPTWFPLVTYETHEGRWVTFRHRTGRSPPAYVEGARVPVTYLPDAPEAALIAEGFWNWLLPLILVVIGGGLTLLGLTGFRATRRRLTAQVGSTTVLRR